MVQTFIGEPRTHNFTFEMVMIAYERRYPTCPQIPIIEEVEVKKDVWSTDNSQRATKRRAKLKVEAPYLLRKVIGVDHVYFIQTSKMDLKQRTLDIEASNETFSNRAVITERCKYFVHPDDPKWTRFEQDASLHVISFFGFEAAVEKVAISQYATYNKKGKQLIEQFMELVIADGITEAKPWSPSDPEYNLKLRILISNGADPVEETETEAHGSDDDPLKQPERRESSALKILSKTDLKKRSSSIKPIAERVKSTHRVGKQATFEQSQKEDPLNSTATTKTQVPLNSTATTKTQDPLNSTATTKTQDPLNSTATTKTQDPLNSTATTKTQDLFNSTATTKTPEMVQVAVDPPFPFKPCMCDAVVTQDASLFTSWDNLVMALLCTLVVIVAFSTMPMFFLFHERHRQ